MNKPYKLMLVDDHEIIRDGIQALLGDKKDLKVIAEASNADELFNQLKKEQPDILILDIALPGMSGVEITKIVVAKYPDIRIIIFAGNADDETVFETLDLGAKGYVTKNSMREELLTAIYTVAEGKEYLSDTISNTMLIKYISKNKQKQNLFENKNIKLTQREIEVLKYITEGLKYKEIGEKLFLSARTIETHKNNLLQKLDLKTVTDLVKYALKTKIV